MVQTRKSNRTRILTTKAKQLEETIKKPILRSISTIDDDESTYNNVSFKKRRTSPVPEQISQFKSEDYQKNIDDDEDENDVQSEVHDDDEDENSDDENIFNSDDDEYNSAFSDYEMDSRPEFVLKNNKPSSTHIKTFSNNEDLHSSIIDHMKLSQAKMMLDFEDALFDSDESDSSSTSSIITPTSSNFNFDHNVGDLKSLEENFQKIINENNKLQSQETTTLSSSSSYKTPIEILKEDTIQDSKKTLKFDEFVNYTEDLSSSSDSELESVSTSEQSSNTIQKKTPSILHYRHDEKHNLAFPDVSTFPIRYDPIIKKRNNGNKLRALNRRAILSGKASEMVGTGVAIGDFNLL